VDEHCSNGQKKEYQQYVFHKIPINVAHQTRNSQFTSIA
jgi:hypothetical protein